MTMAEIKKIEDRVLGDSLRFLASMSSKKITAERRFDTKAFTDSAKKLKRSWEEKHADPSNNRVK